MKPKEVDDPPFLPWTLLCEVGDISFVHYQTRSPETRAGKSTECEEHLEGNLWRNRCDMPADVARIRACQETEAMKLIEAHLSEPYTVAVYRYFLRQWPYLSILAFQGRLLVGAVVCMLECEDGVCMLHGAQFLSEDVSRGSGCSADSGNFALDVPDKGSREATTADQGAACFINSLAPLESEGKSQKAREAAEGTEQRRKPTSSYLHCKCQGQCKASIGMLAVRPEMRGRGIGRQLVRLALQQQQRFVCLTQAAAAAAAPESVTEQKTICEIILSSPTSRPPISDAVLTKLQQAAAAVEHGMPYGKGEPPLEHRLIRDSAASQPPADNFRRQLPCSLQHCWLDMEAGNAPALRLYTSMGFVVAGYRRRYYCSGKDAYKMQYVFGSPFS